MTELPTELMLLGWSVVLLVAAIVLQGQLARRELGLGYNAGPRDEDRRATGAWLWFGSRIVFHLLYLGGVPFVRSLAWLASILGLLLMLLRLL